MKKWHGLWHFLLAVTSTCATAAEMPSASFRSRLPDLPFAAYAAPGRFRLDGQHLMLGYASRTRKWEARVEEYATANPSVGFDYNHVYGDNLGAGISLVRRMDYAETLLSSVFSPRPDLQLKLSAAHLRVGRQGDEENHPVTIVQNGYLLEVKKHWPKASFHPELQFSSYTLHAGRPDVPPLQTDSQVPGEQQQTLARSRGIILQLKLQPDRRSRLHFRHESDRSSFASPDGVTSSSRGKANSLAYSYHFQSCLFLEGKYRRNASADDLRIGLARKRWRLDLAHASNGSKGVHLSYRIPLHGGPKPEKCTVQKEPVFEKVLDETAKRPEQIPSEPLVPIETAAEYAETLHEAQR